MKKRTNRMHVLFVIVTIMLLLVFWLQHDDDDDDDTNGTANALDEDMLIGLTEMVGTDVAQAS